MSIVGRELRDAVNLTISQLLKATDERDEARTIIHEIVKAAGPIEVPHADNRTSIPHLYEVVTHSGAGRQFVCLPGTDLSNYFNQLTEES